MGADVISRVDEALHAFIDTERALLEPEAHPLLDELGSLISSGGKRLRPRFAYWGYRAAGGADGDAIIRVGAALEMLHTMAMIQDDVMDGAATRRNRESAAKRLGPAAAILTGMLGFVLADRLFCIAQRALEASPAATDRYDRLRTDAIAGQYLDVQGRGPDDVQGRGPDDVQRDHGHLGDEATARRVASLKSGRYSVADPLAIGALLAGADVDVVAALDAFGVPLGEAFQIRDDVLGTFGDPSITGKDADGDLREGKRTVLLAKAHAKATPEQVDVLDRVVGHAAAAADDVDAARDVIVATGALEETNRLVDELAAIAKDALQRADITQEAREALLALADEATARMS